jgi:hypothetical protein
VLAGVFTRSAARQLSRGGSGNWRATRLRVFAGGASNVRATCADACRSTQTVARTKNGTLRRAWRRAKTSASSTTVVNSVKNDSKLRFFLAMVEKRPYSSSSNRRGEKFFGAKVQ